MTKPDFLPESDEDARIFQAHGATVKVWPNSNVSIETDSGASAYTNGEVQFYTKDHQLDQIIPSMGDAGPNQSAWKEPHPEHENFDAYGVHIVIGNRGGVHLYAIKSNVAIYNDSSVFVATADGKDRRGDIRARISEEESANYRAGVQLSNGMVYLYKLEGGIDFSSGNPLSVPEQHVLTTPEMYRRKVNYETALEVVDSMGMKLPYSMDGRALWEAQNEGALAGTFVKPPKILRRHYDCWLEGMRPGHPMLQRFGKCLSHRGLFINDQVLGVDKNEKHYVRPVQTVSTRQLMHLKLMG